MQKRVILFTVVSMLLLFFTGCNKDKSLYEKDRCSVVVENSTAFLIKERVIEVPYGTDLSIKVSPLYFNRIIGCDYKGRYRIAENKDKTVSLLLYDVRRSFVLKIFAETPGIKIDYVFDNPSVKDFSVLYHPHHLGINTENAACITPIEGFTLVSWNTEKYGKGRRISLGSRIYTDKDMVLYAQIERWNPEKDFDYDVIDGHVEIKKIKALGNKIVIPSYIKGLKVYSLKKGCLKETEIDCLIMPPGLKKIEEKAFENCRISKIVLFDDVESVSDYSLYDCKGFETLYINAAEPPVYSKNYYGTFADKYDFLMANKDKKKMVLFSGSSARFGYDSIYIEDILQDYKVMDMGVFAYTNALPQMEIIRSLMKEGDVLIHSPEFDASKRQFCTTNALDDDFFCMMEADYDMVSLLDMGEYTQVFSSLTKYLMKRKSMEKTCYEDSPLFYDEDGNETETPSYNMNGDYIVERTDSVSDEPIFGLKVDYSKDAFAKSIYIEPLNREYKRFMDEGIEVYFTYAPRNKKALDDRCSGEVLLDTDEYLRSSLNVEIIGTIEESLVDGRYLSGTDNHLSTKGVEIRTREFVKEFMELKEKKQGGVWQ